MLELKDCNRELLDDLPYIKRTLERAATEAGAHIVGDTFHHFQPQGVTGVLAIAESHICIHTWPEHGYAAADIFTCGTSFDPRRAARVLRDGLESKDYSLTELRRGVLPQAVASP
jgi:S-adenosylmethionine decarboxylase proenzyme